MTCSGAAAAACFCIASTCRPLHVRCRSLDGISEIRHDSLTVVPNSWMCSVHVQPGSILLVCVSGPHAIALYQVLAQDSQIVAHSCQAQACSGSVPAQGCASGAG